MKRAVNRAAALLVPLYLLAACSKEVARTEIVVVVDSDMQTPAELDAVRVTAQREADGAMMLTAEGDAVDENGQRLLPLSVGLTHGGGSLGPIRITATGLRGGQAVVRRVARTSFVDGKRLGLLLVLERDCAGTEDRCVDADRTCIGGSCTGIDVPAASLTRFDGLPEPLEPKALVDAGTDAGADAGDAGKDAGMDPDLDAGDDGGIDAGEDAGPACMAVDELCNEADDDCDGQVDEDFDLGSTRHCGFCNNACPTAPPFAASVCVGGACTLVCAPGTAHCDDDLDNGCETALGTPDDCSGCGEGCSGGEPLCTNETMPASCIAVCPASTPTECPDGSCVNTDSDPFHCGACNTVCDTPANAEATCESGGQCGFACLEGRGDCNDDGDDGCETDLGTDPAHCNGCGNACPTPANSVPICVGGSCGSYCRAGYADCNGDPSDGCEIRTGGGDEDNCGACGRRCLGLTSCCSGSCRTLCL